MIGYYALCSVIAVLVISFLSAMVYDAVDMKKTMQEIENFYNDETKVQSFSTDYSRVKITIGGESYPSSKCSYCGCTNDHIYGTCDYCGAPLEG